MPEIKPVGGANPFRRRHWKCRIALLRLDTDTYASTLHELEALYDSIVTGGVLIIDGYSRGCREAAEAFFSTRPRLFLQRPNSGARAAIKF